MGQRGKSSKMLFLFRGKRHDNRSLKLQVLFRSHPGKPNQRMASSSTLLGGKPEQKFDVNCACFPKEKHQNSQK